MAIGVVIGGLVVLAIGTLVYFLYRRKKNIAGEYGRTNDDPHIPISFVFSKE